MKYIFTLLACFLVSLHSFSQDSTITLSKFEQFTSQPNKILKTEFKNIRPYGSFGWSNVYLFKTTDLISDTSTYAIRIDDFASNQIPSFIDPASFYIDDSDLDSVINVLDYFITQSEKTQPPANLQYTYITSSDIELNCYFIQPYNSWRFSIGKIYKNLRTPVPNTAIGFNMRRIKEFVALLKLAKKSKW